jgi:hypothetical protein
VAWIDEAPAGDVTYYKSSYYNNPIVGSFFNSLSGVPPKVEEIQENIAKLDSVIRALYPLPMSFETKMKLYRNYSWKTYREHEASAIVEALSLG